MDSFIFAVNAVLPLILIVMIGYLIRRIGLIPEDASRTLNKLVFRVFLPCMLFLNVYEIKSLGNFGFGYVFYALIAIPVVFALTIPLVLIITRRKERRGVLLQAVFRSNFALIGIPLAISLCGDAGASYAAVMAAFAVPIFNVLAVITLSVFSGGEGRVSIKGILIDIAKNPLIESVLLGLLAIGIRAILVELGIDWRLTDVVPLFKVISSLSSVATPLALIALGAQFKFSAIGGMKRELAFAILARVVAVPLITLSVAYLFFKFEAAHFATFVALFATPVAVSSVPMTQEMGGDTELAGQIVVWSTASSGITIFLFTFALKLIGVF